MYDWSKIIAAGVGPIIVISACGLLCLAFYNRLAAVVTRLRAFHRERLHEQEALFRAQSAEPADELAIARHTELIGMLEVQTAHVTRRAHWIRQTLSCLLVTIGCLAICSMLVGLAVIFPWCYLLAVPLFVIGLLLLVLGVVFALIEMRHALDPVELESRFVRAIVQEYANFES
jgi:hypothetical protein